MRLINGGQETDDPRQHMARHQHASLFTRRPRSADAVVRKHRTKPHHLAESEHAPRLLLPDVSNLCSRIHSLGTRTPRFVHNCNDGTLKSAGVQTARYNAHRFPPSHEPLPLLLLDRPLVVSSQRLERLLVTRHLAVNCCRRDTRGRRRGTSLDMFQEFEGSTLYPVRRVALFRHNYSGVWRRLLGLLPTLLFAVRSLVHGLHTITKQQHPSVTKTYCVPTSSFGTRERALAAEQDAQE